MSRFASLLGLVLLGASVATGVAIAAFGFGYSDRHLLFDYAPTPPACRRVTADNALSRGVVSGSVLRTGCVTRIRIENTTHLWGEVTIVNPSQGVVVTPFGGLANVANLGIIPPSTMVSSEIFGDSALVYNASFPDGKSRQVTIAVNTFTPVAFSVNMVDLVSSALLREDASTFIQAIESSNSFMNDLGGLTHLQNAYGVLESCPGNFAARCLLQAARELRLSFTSPEESARWVQLFANLGKDVTKEVAMKKLQRLNPFLVLVKWVGAYRSSHFQQPAGSVQFVSHP